MSIDVLQTKIRKMKSPLMVCLDPTAELLPPQLMEEPTLEGLAEGYRRFCFGLLEELQDVVPAVKIQSACFFALGAAGIAVMQQVLQEARRLGYYVVLELMRSDVAHIAELTAQAVFSGIEVGEERIFPYPCDGLVIGAYTGSDGVKPYLAPCKEGGKSLFLLVKTSNKSSREVQNLLSGDRVIFTAMADLAMRWTEQNFGRFGYADVAITASATDADALRRLREKYDRLFLLVTGYGAQGGNGKNAQYAFDRMGYGAVVAAGRSILGAWKKLDPEGGNYRTSARKAAEKMKKDILNYVVIV